MNRNSSSGGKFDPTEKTWSQIAHSLPPATTRSRPSSGSPPASPSRPKSSARRNASVSSSSPPSAQTKSLRSTFASLRFKLDEPTEESLQAANQLKSRLYATSPFQRKKEPPKVAGEICLQCTASNGSKCSPS